MTDSTSVLRWGGEEAGGWPGRQLRLGGAPLVGQARSRRRQGVAVVTRRLTSWKLRVFG